MVCNYRVEIPVLRVFLTFVNKVFLKSFKLFLGKTKIFRLQGTVTSCSQGLLSVYQKVNNDKLMWSRSVERSHLIRRKMLF